ncbi:CidA/LrgA family protein [Limimaricola cinnabarinus]|uniref:Antiholin-like protein LrgA n=1 Tax=Limimaricola cinnabarinus LL-001 TaxID=1337093 RepID=U2Z459_9RHOB|nr:CidA/LrgA family protein [Limimaricola cinnabarinus]GAD56175.1 antiholin-like protein LrgA [Limimaricola cinnabarinus LL-001]
MIVNLVVLLACQLAGEVAARGLGLPIPGPVIGMALLFAAFILQPRLAQRIAATTSALLAHLSLLFVPAGVGVVGHLDTLGRDGVALMAALLLSTVAAILAGVYVFLAVARLTGASE